jgi:Uncharacterised nucleotidyltransferase
MAEPSPLLRALRDPAFDLCPGAGDHAAALLRAHVLAKVGRALADAGVPAILVKGAALGITVYPTPAARPMKDVDLLIRPADRDRATAALAAAGASVHLPAGRPLTAGLLDEIAFMFHAGAMPQLVEIHSSLDKLAARPLGVEAILARSSPAPGLPGLLVPSPEDHALLVAQHAAAHELRHPVAPLDLELLFRRGLDRAELARRAREAGLAIALYLSLREARRLGAASITEGDVAALDPGPIRRALADRVVGEGSLAPAGEDRLGLGWVVRQAAIRDDLGAYAIGVARYAGARARERLGLAGERSAPAAQPARPAMGTSEAVAGRAARGHDAAVGYRVPVWVKAFLAVDRAALRLDGLREGLRDELFLAWIPPDDRAALTAAVYADQSTYLPGGHRFRSGLFPWEKKVLDSPHFPKKGRVLLGAAGAGRELVALLDRGFDVTAFDPCAPFAAAARDVASPRATVLHASYADLVDASQGRPSPLAEALAGPPFDAVVLGWGSLSHVLPASDRAALLRAVRAVAPAAPVLASFAIDADTPATPGSKGRMRDALRRVFSALRAPGVSEPGDHFYPHGGFFSYLGADEIVKLAWDAGYEVALFEDAPYAHAVLQPLGAGKAAGG